MVSDIKLLTAKLILCVTTEHSDISKVLSSEKFIITQGGY